MSTAWYACEEPERPTDALVLWHYASGDDCRGCQLKASLIARLHPDDPHIQWLVGMVGEPS